MITLSLFILTPLATSVGTGGVSSLLVLGVLGNFPIPINGISATAVGFKGAVL